MTEQERAVLIFELRMHGIHPTWVEWALRHGCETYMLEILEGKHQNSGSAVWLTDTWKKPKFDPR